MARTKRQRKLTTQAVEEAGADDTAAATVADNADNDGQALAADADEARLTDAMTEATTEATPDADLEAGAPEAVELEADGDSDMPFEASEDDETDASALTDDDCKRLISALVFASDKPLPLPRIRQLLRMRDMKRVTRLMQELVASTQQDGIVLSEVSTGYQYRTNPRFSGWVQHIIAGRPVRLSRAQLETLAICAYRQPITRPEIDEIRGVDSGATLKILLERNLVKILGKREEAGRPILYGTTKEFLDFFSLGDLRDLPTLREFTELTPENQALLEREQPLATAEPEGTGHGQVDFGEEHSNLGDHYDAPYDDFPDEYEHEPAMN